MHICDQGYKIGNCEFKKMIYKNILKISLFSYNMKMISKHDVCVGLPQQPFFSSRYEINEIILVEF